MRGLPGPIGPKGKLGSKVCQDSLVFQGFWDLRESQESQGIRVYRAPRYPRDWGP